MKKFAMFLMATLLVGFVGCTDSPEPTPDPKPQTPPSIVLDKVAEDMTALTFKATVTNATTAAYVVLADGEELPTPDQILSTGELIDLRAGESVELKATGLEPSTSYQIVAAAKNEVKTVVSNTLYMTTTEQPQLALSVEIVQVDHEKMHFRYTTQNAEKLYYLVMFADHDLPEPQYVITNGKEAPADSRESVEVANLEYAKEYQLLVVVTGANQTLMHDPLLFETEDNPVNVISHTYTRSKGSCLDSGSAFVQFSYEDANEADNFAYNDQWLGLDFRFEPGHEYLPAGTYAVTSDGANFTLLSRYSTYGYDDGIALEKGEVKVSILDGEESQYYRFEIDVYLINGRHFVASYEGEVEGMPIKNTILVKTTFTSAVAEKTSDDGSFWTLTFTDDLGQEACFDLYNSYPMHYLLRNSYTNSNSAEAANTDFEPGEFDGTTSTFTVVGAGKGTHKYATGTLHVDIDWTNELYLVTFFGTLENEVVIEAEYMGPIEGISLAQSETINELTFTKATSTSLDNGAYWTVYLTNSEGYEARMAVECYASPNGLPAGEYTAGVGVGHISLDTSSLTIPGEQTYYFTTLNLTVTIDQQAKSYGFVLEGKLEDGRTYRSLFNGEVEGMQIVEQGGETTQVEWSLFVARHWYSDNWELMIADATEEHIIVFDMRTGNSDLDHIAPGTYTFDTSKPTYLDQYYSKFNNASNLVAAELVLLYDEATQQYDVQFAIELADGAVHEGSYHGPIENSPAME